MEQILQTKKQEKLFIRMDELGRIHLPIHIREELKIQQGDKLYVYKSGINIILEKSNFKVEKEKIFEEKKLIDNEIEVYIEINRIKNSILEIEKKKLRTVDELGNFIIPIEIRKELHITENNILKICIKDGKIILIKNCKSS